MAEIALDIQIETEKREKDIQIGIETARKDIGLSVSRGSGTHYPDYEGSYEVVSALWDQQVLGTRDRRMTEDMTVRAIPIHEVQNASGGMTITIGE